MENEKLEGDQHTRGMGACLPATHVCRVADQLPAKLSKSEVKIYPLINLLSLHLSVQYC